jgi:outer membrane protein OmpA-like peptidoglycan-associated protein
MEVPMPLECDPCPPDDLGCRLSLQPIYFDFDRYNIRPDAEIELAKILAALREYPQLIIHIESHTDSRGNDSYNEALSEKRAQSTLDWLVGKGIDRNRLSSKGYGEYQLQNQCSNGVKCTEEEHQLNRRSMFIIQN